MTAPSATIVIGPGAQLGRYLLGDELGAGGMATVYRARDTELRRDVAVKVLFPHLAKKDDLTKRFQREARAAAGLEHPNILRVYDVGAGASPYIVMELVRGASLRECAEADGALLAELVAAIGALLCDALAVAHGAGVIHRDVKPANVMVADDGRLLLADFGVARLDDDELHTRTGALLGTPSFMAPEQAHGDAVDAKVDLYSVGVTLYQLATGGLPFTGPTAKVVSEAVRGATPALRRAPAVGPAMSKLIGRLMAPLPADRPADARSAASELRALVSSSGLGEPRDEVRAWATDRAGYRAAKLPTVLAATLARAEAAHARGATAVALGLCDRLLALEPGHAGATALVARLTRQGQWRRRAIGGAAAVMVLGATAGGWMMVRGRGAAAPVADASAIDASTIDSGTIDASTIDGGAIDASTIDGGAIDGHAIDGSARDAATRRDAPAAAPVAIDAAAAPSPVDAAAAPAVTDAAPLPARVSLVFDTWCDLSIDGQPRGRAGRDPIELAPGRHALACKQGLGQGAWSETIVVTAGETRTITGSLLAPVLVENGLGEAARVRDRAVARGASLALAPGRARIEVVRDGQPVALGWVDLPPAARCTLRATPELDCYPVP